MIFFYNLILSNLISYYFLNSNYDKISDKIGQHLATALGNKS